MSSNIIGSFMHALPFQPGTSLLFGATLFAVVAFVRRRRIDGAIASARSATDLPAMSSGHQAFAARAATLGAVFALVGWVFGTASQMFLVEPPSVAWWMFATPILGASVGAVIFVVAAQRAPTRSDTPVAPVTRRTWSSFTDRRELGAALLTLGALVSTCLIAGAASSPAPDGWYSFLLFEAGGGPAASTFFGWAFGVPVLLAAALLIGLNVMALRIDSLRPFSRPEKVTEETVARRIFAVGVVRLSLGALLLSLGGAWGLIGYAGMGQAGVGIPGVGDFMWSPGYSALAPAIVWAAWLIQVLAVSVLLQVLFAASARRAPQAREAGMLLDAEASA